MKILSEGGVFREFDGVATSLAKKRIIFLLLNDNTFLELTSEHGVYCKDGVKES